MQTDQESRGQKGPRMNNRGKERVESANERGCKRLQGQRNTIEARECAVNHTLAIGAMEGEGGAACTDKLPTIFGRG